MNNASQLKLNYRIKKWTELCVKWNVTETAVLLPHL